MEGENKAGQEGHQDGSPSADTSSPSEAQLTQLAGQVDKVAEQKAREIQSNADKRAAVAEKTATAAQERAEKAEARATEVERRSLDAELEAARDDPERLTSIQVRQRAQETLVAANKVKAEAERDGLQAQADREAAEAVAFDNMVKEVAVSHELSTPELEADVKAYGLTTKEQVVRLAERSKVTKGVAPSKPDSLIGSGADKRPESARAKMKTGWDELKK